MRVVLRNKVMSRCRSLFFLSYLQKMMKTPKKSTMMEMAMATERVEIMKERLKTLIFQLTTAEKLEIWL